MDDAYSQTKAMIKKGAACVNAIGEVHSILLADFGAHYSFRGRPEQCLRAIASQFVT